MVRESHAQFAEVHRYFTPFALALVTAALVVSRPPDVFAFVAFGVLGFSAFFNWLTRRLSNRPGLFRKVRELRLGVNLTANSFLVFILLPFWRPIWLLFVLTPVATGVYENRRKTLEMSVAIAGLLLWAYRLDGLTAAPELIEGAAHAMFIVFLSLFVNGIAHPA